MNEECIDAALKAPLFHGNSQRSGGSVVRFWYMGSALVYGVSCFTRSACFMRKGRDLPDSQRTNSKTRRRSAEAARITALSLGQVLDSFLNVRSST